MKNKKKNFLGGFTGILFIAIVSILLFSYLGFDLKKIFSSEAVKSNFSFAWEMVVYVWEHFLSKPFVYIWNEVAKPLAEFAWKSILWGVGAIKDMNGK
jgi:hypothetical protein